MTAPTTRTVGIDFAAIFGRAITDDWPCDVDAVEPHPEIRVLASPGEIAESVLAAKVTELCPESGSHDGHNPPAWCDQCPTIGQMLREWQALTALAQYAWHEVNSAAEMMRLNRHDTCDCGMDAARAALEAVRGD